MSTLSAVARFLFLVLVGYLAGLLLSVFLFKNAYAGDMGFLDLKELSINYKNYAMVNDKARNSLIYPEHPKEGINVNINTDLLSYLFWNSTIESLTTGAQYRAIGLETRLGVRLSNYVELGYYHHSQHLMDRHHAYMDKFPVEDAIEVKFYLYREMKRSDTVF